MCVDGAKVLMQFSKCVPKFNLLWVNKFLYLLQTFKIVSRAKTGHGHWKDGRTVKQRKKSIGIGMGHELSFY